MVRQLSVIALVAVAASSQAVIVDDFSVPYFNSIQSGTWVDFQLGGMASGERDVEMEMVSNPFNSFADLSIGGSMSVVSNGFGASSRVYLQYDLIGDEVGNTGPGTVLTNGGNGAPLFAGANNAVRVNFIGNDLNVNVTAHLRLNGALLESNNAVRAAGSGPGALDILMNPGNLSIADSLTLVFEGDTNADFAVRSLEVVPEPATCLAFLGGLGIAAAKRRNRKL